MAPSQRAWGAVRKMTDADPSFRPLVAALKVSFALPCTYRVDHFFSHSAHLFALNPHPPWKSHPSAVYLILACVPLHSWSTYVVWHAAWHVHSNGANGSSDIPASTMPALELINWITRPARGRPRMEGHHNVSVALCKPHLFAQKQNITLQRLFHKHALNWAGSIHLSIASFMVMI